MTAELRGVEDALAGCRRPGCGTPILWLRHAGTGRRAPIDADPAPDGNIVIDLEQGEYAVLAGERLTRLRDDGAELRLNHFVTCKNPPGKGRS